MINLFNHYKKIQNYKGILEYLKQLNEEKNCEKLEAISLVKKSNRFCYMTQNKYDFNQKYESVAEKMKNLNSLIMKFDNDIPEDTQPKFISNLKQSSKKSQNNNPSFNFPIKKEFPNKKSSAAEKINYINQNKKKGDNVLKKKCWLYERIRRVSK